MHKKSALQKKFVQKKKIVKKAKDTFQLGAPMDL